MRVGIYPGSFDPFTVGHDNIARRALSLFDKLVIGVGVNNSKHCMMSQEERVAHIAAVYADEPRIEVRAYSGLTIDFAKSEGAQCIVKGVRTMKDFEEERSMADVIRSVTGIETAVLFSDPRYASVSSSMIKELMHYNMDVSRFVM